MFKKIAMGLAILGGVSLGVSLRFQPLLFLAWVVPCFVLAPIYFSVQKARNDVLIPW